LAPPAVSRRSLVHPAAVASATAAAAVHQRCLSRMVHSSLADGCSLPSQEDSQADRV
jgi:hypothetical protein